MNDIFRFTPVRARVELPVVRTGGFRDRRDGPCEVPRRPGPCVEIDRQALARRRAA